MILATLAGTLALAACEVNLNTEGIVSRETKTFQTNGEPEVRLDTFYGPIEVHSWDRAEVEVEVEKRAVDQALLDEIQVSAGQEGARVSVTVTGPARRATGIQIGLNVIRPSARLRVAVPRHSHLSATTRDGSIVVEDVAGRISLNTLDGSVRGSRLSGELVVRSGDGAIRLERIDGTLDLQTDDGSITVEARPTVLRARTDDGSIRLRVDPESVMAADWDVQTGDGSIVLTLPRDFDAEIDAETRDGSIRGNHPAAQSPTRDAEDRRRRSLRATLGAGGHTVRIRTADGSIRIDD